jgi:hypothetical protein
VVSDCQSQFLFPVWVSEVRCVSKLPRIRMISDKDHSGLSFGIGEAIGDALGDALTGNWRDRDWDDWYRKKSVEGVDISKLPSVETMVAYTDSLRAQQEAGEQQE